MLNITIGECKSKPQWDTTSHPAGWWQPKALILTSVGEDAEMVQAWTNGKQHGQSSKG